MTPRERILTTMHHERPDRIPTVYAARPEVDRMVMAHFATDSLAEVCRLLGAEGWGGIGIGVDFAEFEARTDGELTGDCPYAGARYVFHEPDVFGDAWGVVRRKGRDGRYVEWLSGPLVGADSPDECDFPGPERLMESPDLAGQIRRQKDAGLFVTGGITMPFKTAWELRGLENLLADYLLAPAFVEGLYDRVFTLYGEMARRMVRAGIDMLAIGGDIAMQDRVMMGPEAWRRIDKPRLARLIAGCRSINPDLFVFIHSDGDIRAILPDLIDIGFNVIDPVQPECIDPVWLKREYGRDIVLHGGGSVQRTLPFGTPEDCRAEANRLVEECGYDGGLVIRASNAISFDCPLRNILAFFETVRDHQ